MDFGQTLDDRVLKNTLFSLADPDSEVEQAQLERLRRARERAMARSLEYRPPLIRVGPPVWGEPEWVGSIYPAGTKSAQFLSAFQEQFKTVEINSTFYAVPKPETFLKWNETVSDDFRFCPKFPKSVSHNLHSTDQAELQRFYQGIERMKEKIGMTFLQLPPTFAAKMGDRNGRRLLEFLDSIPRWVKVGVEFRHPIFLDGPHLRREWVDALAERFAATVIVDTPLERAVCHTSLSASRVMVRFLGANLHETDWSRLDQWVERCLLWVENGLQELYFVVHEPDVVHSAKATRYFVQKLNKQLNAKKMDISVLEPQVQDLFGGTIL